MMKLNFIIASRFLSTLSFQTLSFYGFYTVYMNTESAMKLGLLGMAFYIPSFVILLGAGSFADYIKKIGKFYVFLQALAYIPILIFIYSDTHDYYFIVFNLALLSLFRAIRSPIYIQLIRNVSNQTSNMAKLNTLSWQLPLFLGPFLVSYFQNQSSSYNLIMVTLFLQFGSVLLATAGLKVCKLSSATAKESFFKQVQTLKSLKNKTLIYPILFDSLITSFIALGVMLPFLLAQKGLDTSHIGYYKSSFHLTAFICVMFFPTKILRKAKLGHFTFAVFLWGLAPLLLIYFKSELLIFVTILYMGFIDGFSSLIREKILLAFANTQELGRISALNSFFIASGDEYGEFQTGLLYEYLGTKGALLTSATVSFVSGSFLVMHKIKNHFNNDSFITLEPKTKETQ